MLNGTYNWCDTNVDNGAINVNGTMYNNYTYEWTRRKTGTVTRPISSGEADAVRCPLPQGRQRQTR